MSRPGQRRPSSRRRDVGDHLPFGDETSQHRPPVAPRAQRIVRRGVRRAAARLTAPGSAPGTGVDARPPGRHGRTGVCRRVGIGPRRSVVPGRRGAARGALPAGVGSPAHQPGDGVGFRVESASARRRRRPRLRTVAVASRLLGCTPPTGDDRLSAPPPLAATCTRRRTPWACRWARRRWTRCAPPTTWSEPGWGPWTAPACSPTNGPRQRSRLDDPRGVSLSLSADQAEAVGRVLTELDLQRLVLFSVALEVDATH